MLTCNSIVKVANHDARLCFRRSSPAPMSLNTIVTVFRCGLGAQQGRHQCLPHFLKAILEPERVYFNTFLDKERKKEDAVRNAKRKL